VKQTVDMKLGWLAVAAGFGDDAPVAAADVHEALGAAAQLFLRGGGVVSPDAWLALSSVERDAMAWASDRLTEERAALHALAFQQPVIAQALAEGLDAEDLEVRVALKAGVDRVVKKMEGAKP